MKLPQDVRDSLVEDLIREKPQLKADDIVKEAKILEKYILDKEDVK